MTYYELVNFIEDSIDNARNDKLIEVLNAPIKYSGNSRIRLSNHVVEMISERLNTKLNSFIKKIHKGEISNENLAMEFAELKREINYIDSILSSKLLIDIKEPLKESIVKLIDSMEKGLKENSKNTSNTELYSIMKNLNLKEGIK